MGGGLPRPGRLWATPAPQRVAANWGAATPPIAPGRRDVESASGGSGARLPVSYPRSHPDYFSVTRELPGAPGADAEVQNHESRRPAVGGRPLLGRSSWMHGIGCGSLDSHHPTSPVRRRRRISPLRPAERRSLARSPVGVRDTVCWRGRQSGAMATGKRRWPVRKARRCGGRGPGDPPAARRRRARRRGGALPAPTRRTARTSTRRTLATALGVEIADGDELRANGADPPPAGGYPRSLQTAPGASRW
jgi:hypothetical protein